MRIKMTLKGERYLLTKKEKEVLKTLKTEFFQGTFCEALRREAFNRNDIIYTPAFLKRIEEEQRLKIGL